MNAEMPTRLSWLRQQLFATPAQGLLSLMLLAALLWALYGLFDWALLRAVWQADADACQQPGSGACWGMLREQYRVILFGRYPFEQHWRPLLAMLLFIGLLLTSARPRCWRPALLWAWLAGLGISGWLLHGGWGLMPVDSGEWGGLPLSVLLAASCFAGALPLGCLLALGRQSSSPLIRWLCTAYIELLRSLPLVSVLFMAAFLLPLLLPQGWSLATLARVWLGLTLFAAAYLAEAVRGGLQTVEIDQTDAALSLGASFWQIQLRVILPQALRVALPALINSAISLFKETSLITVVSLYELTGALNLALSGSAQWRPFFLEGYLFIGLIYWLGCFSLSRYSQWLERQWQTA